MKINLIFKTIIILISVTIFLKGSFFLGWTNKHENFKNKYGVYLVLAR